MIWFLHTQKLSVTEIHHPVSKITVHGKSARSDSSVQKCCQEFSDGYTNIHEEDNTGQPSHITDKPMNVSVTKFV